MEEILIVCPLSPLGHKKVNEFFVRTYSEKYKVTFIAHKRHLMDIEDMNIKKIEIPDKLYRTTNRINSRISYYKILMWLSKFFNQYNNVLFLSYEIFSLSFYCHIKKEMLKDKKLYLLASNQIDEIDKSITKRLAWESLNNDYYHIVKEKIMKDYIKLNFKKKKVIYIKRSKNTIESVNINPYIQSEIREKYKLDDNKTIIISPSKSSSDFNHINSVLDKLYNDKLTFVILAKDKKNVIKKDGVNVIEGFLDESIYYNLIAISNVIWMPYNNIYNYRSSTVLLEMVEAEKPILARSTKVFENYFSKYAIGELYDDEVDFEQKLHQIEKSKYDYQQIKDDFSNANVKKSMLEKIIF